MNTQANILITGAAGFIASCMTSFLNSKGYFNLILVDDFNRTEKKGNYANLKFKQQIDREQLSHYLETNPSIDLVIHFGARTDTTEMDYSIHETLNLRPSILLWNFCTSKQIPFIYASSAATYGNGEYGYDDQFKDLNVLQPLNPYGISKNEFDKFVLQQINTSDNKQPVSPPHWYGLKFFNVYGPNEYHKGRMASVIFHAFHQIKQNGQLKLFRSHHPDYENGGQMRDFIYVKDILAVTYWLMTNLPESGIYNLGTGKAASFLQLANAVFRALHKTVNIEFIDTPIDIRDKYQYFTEANMNKLRKAGYQASFYDIESGTEDYILNYLKNELHY